MEPHLICYVDDRSILLAFQRSDALLEGSDLLFRVALLLALQGNHGLGGVLHEALVRELLPDRGEEAFEVLNLCLHLLDFLLGIDERAKGYGILVGANHEGTGCGILLLNDTDGGEIGHLLDDSIVSVELVARYGLQLKFLLRCNVLCGAHVAHAGHDELHLLHVGDELATALL